MYLESQPGVPWITLKYIIAEALLPGRWVGFSGRWVVGLGEPKAKIVAVAECLKSVDCFDDCCMTDMWELLMMSDV